MARPNAVVGDVRRLSPSTGPRAMSVAGEASHVVTVEFAHGQTGLLDVSSHRATVWADVLRSLRETGQPAYVEIDPGTGLITEVLLALRYRVGAIRPVEAEGIGAGGLEVELIVSHARHHLSASNPDFEALRRVLEDARERDALVLVTETLDEHEIIDVRAAEDSAAGTR